MYKLQRPKHVTSIGRKEIYNINYVQLISTSASIADKYDHKLLWQLAYLTVLFAW